MENIFLIYFLIVCCYLEISLSDDTIQGNKGIVSNTSNIEINNQIRTVRNYLNQNSEYKPNNYFGSKPISSETARIGDIENILQSYKYEDKTKKKGILQGNYEFEFDAGNPDIHGEISRPCQIYDTFCIRKFFADHSKCKISGRALPDPLYKTANHFYLASSNITESPTNVDFGGLNNARISEFYINKATDNLVIAITFDRIIKQSNNTYFKYYLRGREPVVTRDFALIQYGVVTMTVIIPQINNLNLERSEIYTYGDNDVFVFQLGSGIAASTDPEVLSMYTRFYTNVPTEYQEEISYLGLIAGKYIQYNICDFGLKFL